MANSSHLNTDVYRLVYVSLATSPLELGELLAIGKVAIRNNAELGVTGVLTYCDSKFMQFLEGGQSDVEEIFAKIVGDGRHHSIDILRQGMVSKRQFLSWQMKYVHIHDINESEGYIYNKLFDLKDNETDNIFGHAKESLRLLVAFKRSCPSLLRKYEIH